LPANPGSLNLLEPSEPTYACTRVAFITSTTMKKDIDLQGFVRRIHVFWDDAESLGVWLPAFLKTITPSSLRISGLTTHT
jgi:hypothetical protein